MKLCSYQFKINCTWHIYSASWMACLGSPCLSAWNQSCWKSRRDLSFPL